MLSWGVLDPSNSNRGTEKTLLALADRMGRSIQQALKQTAAVKLSCYTSPEVV